jgi:hypothetical protein
VSYQLFKKVYQLKQGDWVWLQQNSHQPGAVGEVVKVTNTQVHIVRLNSYGPGSATKFHRLDGMRYSAGQEMASHWMADHVHSLATEEDVAREKRKVSDRKRKDREREARKESNKQRVERLRGLFPKDANLRIVISTEDENITSYSLHIHGLSVEQISELRDKLRGFEFPEAE